MKNIVKLLLALSLVFYASFSLMHTVVLADDGYQIKEQKINPGDDVLFLLKRAKEKLILILLTPLTEKKANYYFYLEEARLGELKKVVDNKDIANIQTTSQRFSSTAGQLTDFLKNKNLRDKKAKAKELFEKQLKVLDEFKQKYDGRTSEWRFLEYDINYLKIYSSLL